MCCAWISHIDIISHIYGGISTTECIPTKDRMWSWLPLVLWAAREEEKVQFKSIDICLMWRYWKKFFLHFFEENEIFCVIPFFVFFGPHFGKIWVLLSKVHFFKCFLVVPAAESRAEWLIFSIWCLFAWLAGWLYVCLFVDRELNFKYWQQRAFFVLVSNINTRWHTRLILNIDNRGLSLS